VAKAAGGLRDSDRAAQVAGEEEAVKVALEPDVAAVFKSSKAVNALTFPCMIYKLHWKR
jgi:hypothetical protein